MKILDRIPLRAPLKPLALACAVALGLGAGTTRATLVSIDFDVAGYGTQSGDVAGGFTGQNGAWNSLAIPTGAPYSWTTTLTTGTLMTGDVIPVATSIQLSVNTTNVSYSTYAWPAGPVGDQVLQGDIVWLWPGLYDGPMSWSLSGLNPGQSYDLTMFAGDQQSGYGHSSKWTIGAQSLTSAIIDYASVTFTGVVADGTGKITGAFSIPAGATTGADWSGMQIQYTNGGVTAVTTTTTVASSKNPSTFGDEVTFTASITPDSGSAFPTGSVQFKDGATDLELVTVTQDGSTTKGTATTTISTATLAAGSHTITAEYLPATGSGFATSTGTLSGGQTVTHASSGATLVSIDFDVAGYGTQSGDVAGGFTGQNGAWNSLAIPTGAPYTWTTTLTTGTLMTGDVIPVATSIQLSVNTTNVLYSTYAWPASPVGDQVLQGDIVYLWPGAWPGPMSWSLSGLNPGQAYDLAMFAGDQQTAYGHQSVFTAGTQTGTSDGTPSVKFTGVVADGTGKIAGTFELPPGATGTHGADWAGMQIQYTGGAPVGTPYELWANANAGGQSASEDYDHDGVSNGLKYYMGAAGTLAAISPPVVTNGAARTVTWPRDPTATVTSVMVQVSSDLAIWHDVPLTDPSIVATDPTKIVYTLPAGTEQFCRLVVTP